MPKAEVISGAMPKSKKSAVPFVINKDSVIDINFRELSKFTRLTVVGSPKIVRYKNALQSILAILELEDDWNDNGAKHFEKTLILKCFDILKTLENYPPEIFPVADNSIQMEYDGDDGSYLQFRIYEDKIREFCVSFDGQKITKHIEISEIPEEVKKFYDNSRK